MAASSPAAKAPAMEPSDTSETERVPARRRLFVAAAIDDAARDAVGHAAAKLRSRGMRGRYVEPANYHVTVAFLGYVEVAGIQQIGDTLRDAASQVVPFAITFDTVGAYPNRRKPRVVWAGPAHSDERFAAMCTSVRTALFTRGLSIEGHDDAHVTLLRCERDAPPLPRVHLAARSVVVDALTLFESRLGPHGARYTPLETYPLAGR